LQSDYRKCHCERSEAISLFTLRLLRHFVPRNDMLFTCKIQVLHSGSSTGHKGP